MVHLVYNSKTATTPLTLTALYYNAIDPTTVFFEEEGISVSMDSLGHIEFFDTDQTSLGFVDVPAAESPDMYAHSGQYGTMDCGIEGDMICITLPVYTWHDYYPHCDGESDRWDRKTVGHFRVVYHLKDRTVEILDR